MTVNTLVSIDEKATLAWFCKIACDNLSFDGHYLPTHHMRVQIFRALVSLAMQDPDVQKKLEEIL